MLYTNYKQIAEIHLHSVNCTQKAIHQETLDANKGVDETIFVNFVDTYTFPINVSNKMSQKVKIVLKSFHIKNNTFLALKGTQAPSFETERHPSTVYIKNIHNPNIYSTNSTHNNKLVLFNDFLLNSDFKEYVNTTSHGHIIQNMNLQNSFLEIVVNLNVKNTLGDYTQGCPETCEWSMILEVYDIELEENPKIYANANLPLLSPKY